MPEVIRVIDIVSQQIFRLLSLRHRFPVIEHIRVCITIGFRHIGRSPRRSQPCDGSKFPLQFLRETRKIIQSPLQSLFASGKSFLPDFFRTAEWITRPGCDHSCRSQSEPDPASHRGLWLFKPLQSLHGHIPSGRPVDCFHMRFGIFLLQIIRPTLPENQPGTRRFTPGSNAVSKSHNS